MFQRLAAPESVVVCFVLKKIIIAVMGCLVIGLKIFNTSFFSCSTLKKHLLLVEREIFIIKFEFVSQFQCLFACLLFFILGQS